MYTLRTALDPTPPPPKEKQRTAEDHTQYHSVTVCPQTPTSSSEEEVALFLDFGFGLDFGDRLLEAPLPPLAPGLF